MFIVHIADGWLLVVSLSVNDVLFMLVFELVALGWQLQVVSMVDDWLLVVAWLGNVVLFKLKFELVAVGWHLWISWMVVGVLLSLVVGDGLFKLVLWRSVVVDGRLFVGVGWHGWVSFVVVGLLFGMELLVMAFAGGWLLDGALRSVFARHWRIYCMMLVDGFRWFVDLGCRVECVAVDR